ncbi:MAG: ATP:cob(I)alamin adenosyltransferase, partial [Spirochaetales bacterium]|nr:ATP:cob(I)alamin adenosyltransferase [Spirochaetales bacterium]
RCERRVVWEIRTSVMTQLIPCQVYLNRLSDFLFVSARYWEQISEEE